MNTVGTALVGAASVMLFALFFIGVRRMERDVDYTGFGRGRRDDKLGLLARVVANVIVSSP